MAGADVTPSQLLEAVWVCSTTFKEAYDGISKPGYGLKNLLWAFIVSLRPKNVPRGTILVRKHIMNGLRWPMIYPSSLEGERRACNSPGMNVLLVHLMKNLHQSFDEAINQPLALSYWLYATTCEVTGLGSVIEASEAEELQRQADAFEEAVKRGEVKLPWAS